MLIAPSLLSADFARLADAVAEVDAVADRFHLDVMDGHFVPNLTFGPPVIAALRPHTATFFDTHLMVTNPADLLDDAVKAGSNAVTFHVELGDPMPLIDRLHGFGVDAGLAISPETPFDVVRPYLDRIEVLLVMSVHPGFGGQAFIPEVLDKVRAARAEIDAHGYAARISIDGGINAETAVAAGAAGVDILVAGSAVFRAPDPVAAAVAIRDAGAAARDARMADHG